jgi:CRISPR-associated endonuclease/helicase Cas3
LTTFSKTTAVLCTATQPVLDKLKSPEKGQLNIPKENELIGDVGDLFTQLKRVDISNKTKPQGWSEQEIADLALAELAEKGSCLVIVNTKAWAQVLYRLCAEQLSTDSVFHLSTSQCPAHRRAFLNDIKKRLHDKQPVLCISTQLIEAGVDIDFASVIRFLAGLDSIAQAAGRCNRNGRLETATVHIVNPAKENIKQLEDIKIGRDKALWVLSEVEESVLLAPETMARYFNYYFYERANIMAYPVAAKDAGIDTTLLELLSDNKHNTHPEQGLQLRQSFMTAGRAFKAIDAPTQAVIVPYQEGEALITELCGLNKKYDAARYRACLKKAQKYSVNVFPNVWQKLRDQKAVHEIGEEGVFYLDGRYYHEAFGLSEQIVSKAGADIL